ncbi:MAG: DUF433 domain-containing protein [Chloroflexi bacterium]|nr:DUF433 domain-containing protein [Chloroflexota bacterium]
MPDIPTLSIPLATDENGVMRIRNTRVTLDVIVARYQQGDTPEAIHEGFPSVSLSDVYAVIAYYLANREDVDAYLRQRDIEAERIRQEVETNSSPETTARTEHFRKLAAQKRREAAH